MEAPMCLQAQGIDNKNGGGVRVRRDRGLRDDVGVVGEGRGIGDASKGLETTTEAAGSRRQARGIYVDDRGDNRGR